MDCDRLNTLQEYDRVGVEAALASRSVGYHLNLCEPQADPHGLSCVRQECTARRGVRVQSTAAQRLVVAR